MLSPVFWLSLVVVFWGMKCLAEGLMSLPAVELRRAQPVRAASVPSGVCLEAAPETLDQAA